MSGFKGDDITQLVWLPNWFSDLVNNGRLASDAVLMNKSYRLPGSRNGGENKKKKRILRVFSNKKPIFQNFFSVSAHV